MLWISGFYSLLHWKKTSRLRLLNWTHTSYVCGFSCMRNEFTVAKFISTFFPLSLAEILNPFNMQSSLLARVLFSLCVARWFVVFSCFVLTFQTECVQLLAFDMWNWIVWQKRIQNTDTQTSIQALHVHERAANSPYHRTHTTERTLRQRERKRGA